MAVTHGEYKHAVKLLRQDISNETRNTTLTTIRTYVTEQRADLASTESDLADAEAVIAGVQDNLLREEWLERYLDWMDTELVGADTDADKVAAVTAYVEASIEMYSADYAELSAMVSIIDAFDNIVVTIADGGLTDGEKLTAIDTLVTDAQALVPALPVLSLVTALDASLSTVALELGSEDSDADKLVAIAAECDAVALLYPPALS